MFLSMYLLLDWLKIDVKEFKLYNREKEKLGDLFRAKKIEEIFSLVV